MKLHVFHALQAPQRVTWKGSRLATIAFRVPQLLRLALTNVIYVLVELMQPQLKLSSALLVKRESMPIPSAQLHARSVIWESSAHLQDLYLVLYVWAGNSELNVPNANLVNSAILDQLLVVRVW